MTESTLSVIEDKPNPALIAHLEEMLAEAKTGELQGMVYAATYRANYVGSGWAGVKRNHMRLMGAMYQLLHDLAGQA